MRLLVNQEAGCRRPGVLNVAKLQVLTESGMDEIGGVEVPWLAVLPHHAVERVIPDTGSARISGWNLVGGTTVDLNGLVVWEQLGSPDLRQIRRSRQFADIAVNPRELVR